MIPYCWIILPSILVLLFYNCKADTHTHVPADTTHTAIHVHTQTHVHTALYCS